jgi:Transcription factor zinc-finger
VTWSGCKRSWPSAGVIATEQPPAAPACPRCTAPMQHLALPTHGVRPVLLDHCRPCRLVWFDALESLQLDDLGWVRLLRELQQGEGLPLAQAIAPRRACPRCKEPLKVVHNRTRFGVFAALECPRGDGHLHGHSGLLAEKGLVRPLGLAERRALAAERHALACLNCGGPAEAADDRCSWCGTALVVIDVPRLAHALRLRTGGMGDSPEGRGHHVAWACHGCGAPLDPGRDTQCPHCEHLVVAQRLPDIEPLLAEAEAELAAAAAATALRLARYPSQQPEALARARAQPEPGPVAVSRRDHWIGWLPLLALLVLALAIGSGAGIGLWKQWQAPGKALLAHPLDGDIERSWSLADAYRRLRPADTEGLHALRAGLLDRQLQLLAGETPPMGIGVGDLVAWFRQPTEEERLAAGPRWAAALQRRLRYLGSADDTLPLETARTRLVAEAPGIWVDAETRRRAWWVPTFEVTGSLPVPVGAPSLRLMADADTGVPWRCEREPGAEPLLLPGARLRLQCSATIDPGAGSWARVMQALNSGAPPRLQWAQGWIDQPARWEAALDRTVATAAERYMPWEQRWYKGPPRIGGFPLVLALLAGAMVAFVAYCALARHLGERRAGLAVWLLLAVPAWLGGRGEGAASVLLVGGYLALAAILVFGCAYGWRLYRDRVLARYD